MIRQTTRRLSPEARNKQLKAAADAIALIAEQIGPEAAAVILYAAYEEAAARMNPEAEIRPYTSRPG